MLPGFTTHLSGDLKSRLIWNLNGQKEVWLQIVLILNGIWNPEAQPFEIMRRVPFLSKNIWNLEKKTFLPCLFWGEYEREFYIEMVGLIQYLDISLFIIKVYYLRMIEIKHFWIELKLNLIYSTFSISSDFRHPSSSHKITWILLKTEQIFRFVPVLLRHRQRKLFREYLQGLCWWSDRNLSKFRQNFVRRS